MRYVFARTEQAHHEQAYRIMVTESLRAIPQGRWTVKSYVDLITPEVKETRTGKQVAEEVAEKMGTKVDWGR